MAAPCRSTWRLWNVVTCQRLYLQPSVRHYVTGNRNVLTLHERGIFQNVFPEDRTPELLRHLIGSPQCFYCGFDPTADSLHIGNLLVIMALLHCQRAGHNIIALLGGATAQIGDPSGKTTERPVLHLDTMEKNIQSIEKSLRRIFNHHEEYFCKDEKHLQKPLILDNRVWYAKRNVIEFLSSVGREFRMGTLLGRSSVQSRLNSPEGMSLTEFTYQIFQSYDWLHLYKNYNCIVQIGGNDQMGNIVAGHELINRVTNKGVFGLTVPLVTSSTGDKLGKTAGNAVWLNADKTSEFEFYQYYIQRPDADVEKYLKLFTFLPDKEIELLMTEHKKHPEQWKAQKKLAAEVTRLIHGESGLQLAMKSTEVLFNHSPNVLAMLTEEELEKLFHSADTTQLLLEPGTTIMDMVMKAKCFSRQADANRIISQGGLYINQQRQTNPEAVLIPGEHILPNNITLIRVGKKFYYIVKWLK